MSFYSKSYFLNITKRFFELIFLITIIIPQSLLFEYNMLKSFE